MDIQVLFQDDYIVIISKPAGVVVNRAESVKEPTIQDWMEETHRLEIGNDESRQAEIQEFTNRSGVVHRLDKETSGVMVLARNVETFLNLKQQFKKRQTQKQYIALVHGNMTLREGTVNLPLKRNPFNRRRFTIAVDGKMGRTKYQVSNYFSRNQELFTLLNLWPKTGRTHQLRVHLSHLGFPIVSDPIYLGKRLSADLTWCPRLFLHAKSLSFFHPRSGEKVVFESGLAEDLQTCLSILSEVES
ncbi:RluA family pseudouridine synthase [Candidatus Beckwithbacteria bacterium]|nr:RluA family pseudouridine synthase [Candidatus Beckwithbacteria bacterium]